jgi:hypothetical protein
MSPGLEKRVILVVSADCRQRMHFWQKRPLSRRRAVAELEPNSLPSNFALTQARHSVAIAGKRLQQGLFNDRPAHGARIPACLLPLCQCILPLVLGTATRE